MGQSSVDSSRRNSLAPLPDVDYGVADGDRFQLRDLDEAELFRRSVSMEQPMPRPRRLGISGGKPITQVDIRAKDFADHSIWNSSLGKI